MGDLGFVVLGLEGIFWRYRRRGLESYCVLYSRRIAAQWVWD